MAGSGMWKNWAGIHAQLRMLVMDVVWITCGVCAYKHAQKLDKGKVISYVHFKILGEHYGKYVAHLSIFLGKQFEKSVLKRK